MMKICYNRKVTIRYSFSTLTFFSWFPFPLIFSFTIFYIFLIFAFSPFHPSPLPPLISRRFHYFGTTLTLSKIFWNYFLEIPKILIHFQMFWSFVKIDDWIISLFGISCFSFGIFSITFPFTTFSSALYTSIFLSYVSFSFPHFLPQLSFIFYFSHHLYLFACPFSFSSLYRVLSTFDYLIWIGFPNFQYCVHPVDLFMYYWLVEEPEKQKAIRNHSEH